MMPDRLDSRTNQQRPRTSTQRPLIGVLCCNEVVARPVQTVASRFIEPLVRISNAAVLLVPALADSFDAACIASRLDGLLLTGSRSNVAGCRYGRGEAADDSLDEQRDEVALSLAGRMIESGKPVFGICRGLQELNVLFGGTLRDLDDDTHHPAAEDVEFADLFLHRHEIELAEKGQLAAHAGQRRISVNSVHRQGIDQLGCGLEVEAVSATGDTLIEAFSCRPCGADVIAVQWHPELDTEHCRTSRGFFALVGRALSTEPQTLFGRGH